MRTPVTAAALGLTALLLVACDKRPGDPLMPPPATVSTSTSTGSAASPAADPSLPTAASVIAPAAEGTAAPAPSTGRTNAGLTNSQESSAMPMAGQNNDHSAPLAPAASGSSANMPR